MCMEERIDIDCFALAEYSTRVVNKLSDEVVYRGDPFSVNTPWQQAVVMSCQIAKDASDMLLTCWTDDEAESVLLRLTALAGKLNITLLQCVQTATKISLRKIQREASQS